MYKNLNIYPIDKIILIIINKKDVYNKKYENMNTNLCNQPNKKTINNNNNNKRKNNIRSAFELYYNN